MKIWYGFGTEHSAALVLVGTFEAQQDAKVALERINQLREQVDRDYHDGAFDLESPIAELSQEMKDFLIRHDMFYLSPTDLQQLVYECKIEINENKIAISTDELDVSGF